ncbi:MAG: SIR2 family protein [Ferruginibacter sp.]
MSGKKGIYYTQAKGILKITGHTPNWSLVVGAGVSYPIFPSWKDLIKLMYTNLYKTKTTQEIDNMIESFPLDSILQSLKNFSQLDDSNFSSILSQTLYTKLWSSLRPRERNDVFKVLANPVPGAFPDSIWESFFVTMKDNYRTETFYKLAEVLLKGYIKGITPASVISFNAEALLHTTLASLIREHYGRNKKHAEKVKQKLDIVTRSISVSIEDRIPFYHIHGYLPVPFLNTKVKKSLASLDKLVFSENDYLNLANSSFNWQSSIFLHASYTNSLVFIGLSFSDINLRKWLSWTYSNRLKEIQQFNPAINPISPSSKHYWIRTRPKTATEESLLENNVAHLGVRIIWIDSYSQIADALAILTGIK